MNNKNNLKDELVELVKPIVIHEAKSLYYKTKLFCVVTGRGVLFVNKKAKNFKKFTIRYIEELKND